MHSTRRLVMAQFASAGLAALLVLAATLLAAPHGTTAQGSAAVSSGLLPRFISLSPTQVHLDINAQYSVGGGPTPAGVYLSGAGFARIVTGFTLPPDYNPGSDVTLRIMWANGAYNAINCTFDLWSNGVSAYRPGTSGFAYIPPTAFSNGQDYIFLAAGATPTQVRAAELTIQGTSGDRSLQPGDALHILIARRADDATDTCTGALVITGLDATYQGRSTYVPLIAK